MDRELLTRAGIVHPAVLRVMESTLREAFVPADLQHLAHEDGPLPIGFGATISQPTLVARMTQLLEPEPHHRALELGTGSGYQSAILGPLVGELYTIEVIPELAESARARLQAMGHRNIQVREGDGNLGWPDKAPFDRIILTASPPDIPPAVLDQLAPGGRLVGPAGTREQHLLIVDRDPNGRLRWNVDGRVMFVPLVQPRA